MNYILAISQVLISEWIWSMGEGLYHNIVNVLFMFALLKLLMGIKIVPALLLSFSSQIVAFLFFNLFVIGVLILGLGISYSTTEQWAYIPSLTYAPFYFGCVTAILQSLFFITLATPVNKTKVVVLVFISNTLASLVMNLAQ